MNRPRLNTTLKLILGCATLAGVFAVNALTWPSKPLGATITATPMTMLIAGRDHKLFYEAYNDASDIDEDGTMDTRFKPAITYYGLFDSSLCYSFSGTQARDSTGNTGLFSPAATAGSLGKCTSNAAEWSGNWLNYVTTSRIDALRKVLYGGFREVDSETETILRRAYIPQDAHSWAKEYTSESVDGYDIRDYTPLSLPTGSGTRRHFFGNLTYIGGNPEIKSGATVTFAKIDAINCATLSNCSNLPPLLSVVTNSTTRVWEWASTERPVLREAGTHRGTNPTYYAVRVKVCAPPYTAGCRQYPNGQYKPVGLLHEYGENNAMLFGLITGGYDLNLTGGLLRKVVSSFTDEVNANTGIFNSNGRIVHTFNSLRIRDFNNGNISNQYKGGWQTTSAMTEGTFPDWGNPIAEMLYEGLRYFSGKSAATSSYVKSTRPIDADIFGNANNTNTDTWDDPYSSTSNAKAAWCARANFLTISDINVSFDSDNLPGVYSGFGTGIATDISGLSVKTLGDTITAVESSITGLKFIGQSNTSFDTAPTPKTVTSLGTVRGIAPEEPTKQGSYYSASIAYYGRTNDLRSDIINNQSVDTFSVALASPLPTIGAKLPNGRIITVVPFAKSVQGSSISATKGSFQPTNQIVDFYVDTIANSGSGDQSNSINGGRYYAKFRINFEDVEQGADHDMDAISEYEISANSDNTLSIKVTPTYQAGGIQHHMGYIISGSTQDGVYLVARDENNTGAYFLNVPAGRTPGYCDMTTPPADCATLPTIGSTIPTYTFTPSTTGSATFLKDPLWYASKWGGFQDRNNSKTPDLPAEWDSDNDGVPDTYFLVQNPLKLRDTLKRTFDNIVERSGSGGNIIANSTVLSTDTLVFQGVFNSSKWSGDLIAYPATSSAGVGDIASWNAALNIPGPTNRNIFYSTASGAGDALPTSSFPNSWSTTLTGYFNNSTDLLKYLRGDRTRELLNGGSFRDRKSDTVLGDIAHSSPVYVKDTETVYVGANDGMLHAFNARTGVEQFAFIPSSVLPRIKNLANLNYNEQHEYFVDGDIAVSNRTQTTNKNYLVATLGRGGKGLFGLDVSSPTSFAKTDIEWEYFSTTDPDLGFMLGRPVIARMNNNDWVVIVGNGYNSTSGNAALYIFDLINGDLIKKIVTSAGGDNGLATPGTYDSNNDGKVDFIYAGDLNGNVWKFDVTSTNVSGWALANSNAPIFQARDATGNIQPITAPITAAKNTVTTDPNFNSVHLFFGTGSYFQSGDPSTIGRQTWYSIIDRSTTLLNRSNPLNKLVQRSILQTGTFDGKSVRTFSAASTNDTSGKDGCFIDLPATGERMVTASKLFQLMEPTLIASSIIPVVDQCIPGGNGYVNAINPFTCGRLGAAFFDVNNNGQFVDDLLGGINIGSMDLGVGMPGEAIIIGNRLAVGGSIGTVEDVRVNSGLKTLKGRISWREIIRN